MTDGLYAGLTRPPEAGGEQPVPVSALPPAALDNERYELPTAEVIPFDVVQIKIAVAEMKIAISHLEDRLADMTAHLARIGAGRSAA